MILFVSGDIDAATHVVRQNQKRLHCRLAIFVIASAHAVNSSLGGVARSLGGD